MGNGETYFTKAKTDFLFLTKKVQNFPSLQITSTSKTNICIYLFITIML